MMPFFKWSSNIEIAQQNFPLLFSTGVFAVSAFPQVYQLPDEAVIALPWCPVIIHPVLGGLPDADSGTGFTRPITIAFFFVC
jgi:hypothetical protein